MEQSKNTTASDFVLERLAENLDSTSKLTTALLTEIRESEADFASIKTELGILRENVKGLSAIIRDGNGATSLLTKIALMEQKFETIDKWISNHVDVHQRSKKELNNQKETSDEISKRLSDVEKSWYAYKDKLDRKIADEEEKQRLSYHRAEDLAKEKEKQAIIVKAERQSATIKALVALALGLIGVIGAWITAFFATK